MSVLTEIIIADHSVAGNIAESYSPTESWTGFEAKGINPVNLGQLYAILSGCIYEDFSTSNL